MDWREATYPVMAYFRRKRLAELLSIYPDISNYSVLDVGGRPFIWDLLREYYNVAPKRLVILNTPSEVLLPESENYTIKIADGRRLPYAEDGFDLVFSNSVIEHVGDFADQTRMAEEVRRVGKRYFLQTPNRFFPVEPHFLFPLFQFFPLWFKTLLIQNFNLGWRPKTSNRQAAKELALSVQLLSKRQLKRLFPGAKVHTEKFWGLNKSYMMCDGWE